MTFDSSQLATALSSSPDATFVIADDGRIVFANEAVIRVFGYAPDEIVGSLVETLIPARWRDIHVKHRSHFMGQPECGSMTTKLPQWAQHKQGYEFAVDNNLNPVVLAGQRYVICTVRSLRIRAPAGAAGPPTAEDARSREVVAELLNMQERLELFIRHTPAAVAIFDRDMRYIVASDRWRADYGLDTRQLRGRSHYEIFPEIPERWKEFHRRGLAGETIRVDEDSFVRQDGRVEWLRWEILPWRNVSGAIGGIAILTEVTTAERMALQRLRESEQHFAALFYEAAVAVAVQEAPSGKFLNVNPEWTRLFGYTEPEVRGKTSWDLGINTRTERAAEMAHALSEGDFRAPELWLRAKSGRYVPVLVSVRVANILEGERFVITYTDLTELKRLEGLLADAISEEQTRLAQELHDGLGQVLTGASLLSSALTREATRTKSPLAAQIAQIEDLISASIATARSIAHGLSPLFGPNRTVIGTLKDLASLHAKFPPPVPRITVSGEDDAVRDITLEAQSQLYRIAQEAIQNALKHAAARRIDVSFRRTDGQLVLTIADNGRGMSTSGLVSGRGLPVMRRRASIIGAMLAITDRPGGGTVVKCALPVAPSGMPD